MKSADMDFLNSYLQGKSIVSIILFMFDVLKAIGSFFLDIIETIVVSLAIFVVVYLFLFQPHQVRGNSMFPNYHDGEYILTDKISYRFGQPKRGDVIVFKAPRNEEVDYIKRIIGLPGEEVELQNGFVYINQTKLPEFYLADSTVTLSGTFLTNDASIKIPKGEYFVLGDNRDHSSDSREWGLVKREEIVGKAFLRYWPLPRFGIFPAVSYSETRAL